MCSIDTGVVFLDVLNNAERISDHCSNIAARLIGMDASEDYDSHTLKSIMHHNPTKDYMLEYEECRKTYLGSAGRNGSLNLNEKRTSGEHPEVLFASQ